MRSALAEGDVLSALTEYDVGSLRALFAQWGYKPSHADRLLKAFYQRSGEIDLAGLGLGKSLRARIEAGIPLRQSRIAARTASADGTVKLLVELSSGGAVEAVLMPSHRRDRAAGCLSSQVGCAMGCDFCASTRDGLARNLSPGEIVEQFLHLKAEAARESRRLVTLVYMGIGEPMHNLDAVIESIQRIASPAMGGLSRRAITISTVGIVPGIERLAEADLNVHLALSLHAPDDATRQRLIPANRRWGVGEILRAARHFANRTGRIVTIEYCLLDGVNDSADQAQALAELMGDFRAHVNLIPYNPTNAPTGGRTYRRPAVERVKAFLDVLTSRGVIAHVRRSRGDDASAACGQLRAGIAAVTAPVPR